MTSKTTTLIQEADGIARFPVFAPRDDMQNWLHLYDSAVLTALSVHFAELSEHRRGKRGAGRARPVQP